MGKQGFGVVAGFPVAWGTAGTLPKVQVRVVVATRGGRAGGRKAGRCWKLLRTDPEGPILTENRASLAKWWGCSPCQRTGPGSLWVPPEHGARWPCPVGSPGHWTTLDGGSL